MTVLVPPLRNRAHLAALAAAHQRVLCNLLPVPLTPPAGAAALHGREGPELAGTELDGPMLDGTALPYPASGTVAGDQAC